MSKDPYLLDLYNLYKSYRSKNRLSQNLTFNDFSKDYETYVKELSSNGWSEQVNNIFNHYYGDSDVDSQRLYSQDTLSSNNSNSSFGLDPVNAGIQSGVAIGNLVFDIVKYEQQKEINERNFKHQLEVEEYNRKLQQQIFQREDTAYSRAAADLQASGLSKQLIGSGFSSGSVTSVTPAQQEAPQGEINTNSLLNVLQALQSMQLQKQAFALQQKQSEASILATLENLKLQQDKFELEKETLKNNKTRSGFSNLFSLLSSIAFLRKIFI